MIDRNIRTIKLIGDYNFKKLQESKVTIIGVGGVGGIAAQNLIRSGICNIRLIDFDKYVESNLNRQIGSNMYTLGKYKVDVLEEEFSKINPEIHVEKFYEKLDENNYSHLLHSSDYILDMCDDVKAKTLIAKYCIDNNIKFISAMGAGNRTDVSKLKFTTLDKTSYCMLAKTLRKTMDKRLHKYVKCLYYEGESISVKGVVGTIAPPPNYMGVRAAAELINFIMED